MFQKVEEASPISIFQKVEEASPISISIFQKVEEASPISIFQKVEEASPISISTQLDFCWDIIPLEISRPYLLPTQMFLNSNLVTPEIFVQFHPSI